jgi:phosphatidate cytidylyltransferase
VISASIIAPVCLAALWLGGLAWQALIVALALGMAMEWMAMSRDARSLHPVVSAGILASGVCYLGPATLALIWMRGDNDIGRANVLFVLLVVWASDIGAYLAGRAIGGKLLAPLVSPGKTWSGAVGGLCSAMLVGAGAALLGGGAVLHGMLVAALLGIASQLGDLLESALKRHFGVKDSGRLIPGHGGLLDRLDGLLMAAPVAAALILALGRGMMLWR